MLQFWGPWHCPVYPFRSIPVSYIESRIVQPLFRALVLWCRSFAKVREILRYDGHNDHIQHVVQEKGNTHDDQHKSPQVDRVFDLIIEATEAALKLLPNVIDIVHFAFKFVTCLNVLLFGWLRFDMLSLPKPSIVTSTRKAQVCVSALNSEESSN